MDLIVPDPGRLPKIEHRLGSEGLSRMLAGLRASRVALGLPKVRLSSQFELSQALAALGAPALFSERADLSAITTEEPLKLSQVVHEVKLTIEETGTEAAAATGVARPRASSTRRATGCDCGARDRQRLLLGGWRWRRGLVRLRGQDIATPGSSGSSSGS